MKQAMEEFKEAKFGGRYYEPDGQHHDYVSKRIKDALKGFRPNKILDLGAGNGEYSELFPEAEYTGVDCSETQVNRMKMKGLRALKLDLDDRLPFQNDAFDLVLLIDVIEHVYNNYELMKEIRRVLVYKGKLVIIVPNSASFYNRIHVLKGNKPGCVDSFRYDDGSTLKYGEDHINAFSKIELVKLLDLCSFGINYIGGTNAGWKGRLILDNYLPSFSESIIVGAEV